MNNLELHQRLKDYGEWKTRLVQAIENYQQWLHNYGNPAPELKETLLSVVRNLASDRVTLAFAAEFSRGKTELINSMFFSETGLRLLPSTPGRTTMCPTELFYDADGGSYIRLLPIESRLEEMSLEEHKKGKDGWVQIDLDCSFPIQMQEAFKELVSVKRVSREAAIQLGLYHEESKPGKAPPPKSVEIPCWRHALISFPHELFKNGLVILDTPGLNALGSEPELTLNMLPNAQAVIFVIAADSGVTQSDLEMWQHHIQRFRSKNKKGLAVVMNKIDALWDDLQNDDAINQSIRSQVSNTASTLEIDEDVIFPVSAKQALLAKVKEDDALLEKSRIGVLESFLANDVLREGKQIIIESVSHHIGLSAAESLNGLDSESDHLTTQIKDLQRLSGTNTVMTERLMVETREEQSKYLAKFENFQVSRRLITGRSEALLEALDREKVNTIISRTKKQMANSLTTIGMKSVMKKVIDELTEVLETGIELSEQTRRLVNSVYKKFNDDNDFKSLSPPVFSMTEYQLQMEQLFTEVEAFRSSTSSTLMEQSLVVKKLYSSIIGQAKDVLRYAYTDAKNWTSTALSPLTRELNSHKRLIETRLEMLRDFNNQTNDAGGHIEKLESQQAQINTKHDELIKIIDSMGIDMSLYQRSDEMANSEPLAAVANS